MVHTFSDLNHFSFCSKATGHFRSAEEQLLNAGRYCGKWQTSSEYAVLIFQTTPATALTIIIFPWSGIREISGYEGLRPGRCALWRQISLSHKRLLLRNSFHSYSLSSSCHLIFPVSEVKAIKTVWPVCRFTHAEISDGSLIHIAERQNIRVAQCGNNVSGEIFCGQGMKPYP